MYRVDVVKQLPAGVWCPNSFPDYTDSYPAETKEQADELFTKYVGDYTATVKVHGGLVQVWMFEEGKGMIKSVEITPNGTKNLLEEKI